MIWDSTDSLLADPTVGVLDKILSIVDTDHLARGVHCANTGQMFAFPPTVDKYVACSRAAFLKIFFSSGDYFYYSECSTDQFYQSECSTDRP
jgi:hypothetical protein